MATRLDPTHPSMWSRTRAMGKPAFLFRFGILAIGVPCALAVNAAVLALRGDADLLLSAANVFELTFTLLMTAPLVGAIAGHALWARGERRSGAFDAWDPAESTSPLDAVTEPDAEQRRLSALEARIAEMARTAPSRLTWRVLALTVLGYAYVVMILAAIALSAWWLLHVQGEFRSWARIGAQMLGWFGVSVLFALWVRLLEPSGRRITRAGSPALFDALDDIRRTIETPLPDVVLVDGELNASVSEIPRYGIFGLPKRYLVIGLPLLEALPADECRAILAHELAHLSRRHGRRLVWTARLSVTWRNLAMTLAAGRHWGRGLFLPFFRWYAPRFDLHAKAIARRDEHESDALAAECAGASVAARALLRLHVAERFLSDSVLLDARRESAVRADPPSGVFERMATALRGGPPRADTERWLRSALGARTLDDQTHPSLTDRIRRLGVELADGEAGVSMATEWLLAPTGANGADELLGERRLPKVRAQIESEWQSDQSELWRHWHADALIWQGASDATDVGDDAAARARARWATDCEPRDVALPLVREVLRRDPAQLEASVCLGKLLADSDDASEREEGVRLLEQVLRRDCALAMHACDMLTDRFARAGRPDEVERVRTRQRQLESSILNAMRERSTVRATERFAPYALPGPTLTALRRAAAAQRSVSSVHLVRRRREFLGDQPSLVLAVRCDVPWYKSSTGPDAREACQALMDCIVLPELCDLLVIPLEPRSAMARRLRAMPAAMVYRRESRESGNPDQADEPPKRPMKATAN